MNKGRKESKKMEWEKGWKQMKNEAERQRKENRSTLASGDIKRNKNYNLNIVVFKKYLRRECYI